MGPSRRAQPEASQAQVCGYLQTHSLIRGQALCCRPETKSCGHRGAEQSSTATKSPHIIFPRAASGCEVTGRAAGRALLLIAEVRNEELDSRPSPSLTGGSGQPTLVPGTLGESRVPGQDLTLPPREVGPERPLHPRETYEGLPAEASGRTDLAPQPSAPSALPHAAGPPSRAAHPPGASHPPASALWGSRHAPAHPVSSNSSG